METELKLYVNSTTEGDANRLAAELSKVVADISGVTDVRRERAPDSETMDLGATIGLIVTSTAAASLAHGLADWLRARRNARITVERRENGAYVVVAENVDGRDATTIIETIKRKEDEAHPRSQ
jgi:hypothetical protein